MSTQKNGGKSEVENWEFSIKQDSEAGQSVIVCAQGEYTTVTAQHFPDKHQANPLPVRLGGEEGTEEFSFGLFTYPRTIVNDFDRSGGQWSLLLSHLAVRFLRHPPLYFQQHS